ncbi:hypothetical protein LCGC14_0194730 [marine sediment metagenome]|uniref:Uncharacterized protein n=1 Tax=marine sediment metagenome TaxID=412755 RepID=A0A0F9X470_9ZZZZ
MSHKKQQTEIITGSYIYDDIRMAMMLGGESAVLEFEALLLALYDSMLRETFSPDNYLSEYRTGNNTILINATGGAFLYLVRNVLIDFGMHAKANLSGKAAHTTEGVIGAITNVRRFDILDDEHGMEGNKSTLRLYPRHMQEVSAGAYGWMDKAWQGWNDPKQKLVFGKGGDIQVSPVIEEQVRIYLWAITQVMEADYLYKRYAIMQEKLERAIKAVEEQIGTYDTLTEEAVDRMTKQKVKITKMAGNSLIELRQVIRYQKLVQDGIQQIADQLADPESPINVFSSVVERGETVLVNLYEAIEQYEKKGDFLKGQLVVLNRTLNQIKFELAEHDIPFQNLDERFGLKHKSFWQKIKGLIPNGRRKPEPES